MIDFLDLGCSIGSIEYSKKIFGGKSFLGVNINSSIVKECCEKGYNVVEGDITNLKIQLPKCKYITSLHVLEHLNNKEEALNVIKLYLKTAFDFMYFSIPNFDDDKYLESLGLKFSWSYYSGHKNKITTDIFKDIICNKLKLTAKFGKSILVKNSFDKEILPISAPIDTLFYDESLGKKEYIDFNNIYRENYVFIKLRDINYWEELIETKLWSR